MSLGASAVQAEGNQVHANGIDIHYVEAGEGEPLILLHGGVVSTNLIWEGVPMAYASHMERSPDHFRVIAPDTRGGGRTAHSGSEEVTLRPAGRRRRRADRRARSRATADHRLQRGRDHGDDRRDPPPRSGPRDRQRRRLRRVRPERPERSRCAGRCSAAARTRPRPTPTRPRGFFEQSDEMRADVRADEGRPGRRAGTRATGRPTSPGVPADLAPSTRLHLRRSPQDLRPTLILTGDRDNFCSVEEGVTAYRMLPDGELAILPNTGHLITPAAIETTIEFFERQLASPSGSTPAAG